MFTIWSETFRTAAMLGIPLTHPTARLPEPPVSRRWRERIDQALSRR